MNPRYRCSADRLAAGGLPPLAGRSDRPHDRAAPVAPLEPWTCVRRPRHRLGTLSAATCLADLPVPPPDNATSASKRRPTRSPCAARSRARRSTAATDPESLLIKGARSAHAAILRRASRVLEGDVLRETGAAASPAERSVSGSCLGVTGRPRSLRRRTIPRDHPVYVSAGDRLILRKGGLAHRWQTVDLELTQRS